MRELNPPRETKNSGVSGGRNYRKSCCQKAEAQRQGGRRVAQHQASSDRDRDRRKEIIIATHNMCTMTGDGKRFVGRVAEILGVHQEMDCDIVSLQKTRRSDQSALLLQAG